MGVYQVVFDGQVGASLSDLDLLHPFKRKRPKTSENSFILKTLRFGRFLDVFDSTDVVNQILTS